MKPQHYLFIALLILFFSYMLRVHLVNKDTYWVDEKYTWDTLYFTKVESGFVYAMQRRLTHMPLYFALLLTYPGDHSLFSMRFPSVLLGLLTIAMTMRIMTHLYRAPRWGLLAGFMLGIHAMFIMHSRTARMYPLLNFLIATISYLFLRYSPFAGHIYQHLITIALTILALLTHLIALIVIPAQGLIKLGQLIKRTVNIQNLLHWGIMHTLLTIPAFIWAVFVFNRTFDGLSWVDPLTLDRTLYGMQSVFLGTFNRVSLPYWQLGIPIFLLSILLFLILFRRIKYASYWFGLTLLPSMVLIAISPIKLMFHQRYLSSALFAYVLVVVLGFKAFHEKLAETHPKTAQYIVGTLIVVYLLVMAFLTLSRMPDGRFVRVT